MTQQEATLALENIEHAAHAGYIRCPLAEITARLLRLEVANSETEADAIERAEKFIESVKE